MTAALFYFHEAYSTSGPKLMGRNAAGESFVRGFIRHSQGPEFWLQAPSVEQAQHFAQTAAGLGRREPVKVVLADNLAALSEPGLLYYPGPDIGGMAHQRSLYGNAAWSLCGITHTTSSARAMNAITEWLTAPVQPWDAIVCTSRAVKDNVEKILQAQADYLQARLGITRLVLPQLPVIPLGLHVDDFIFTGAQREAARQALNIDADTLVVMYIGRLSFHAKAHPLAMYQALQQATLATGKQVVLIECGWHHNDGIARAFAQAAAQACAAVRVITLDGRVADNRQQAWSAADVFCSLSDNIQETFGIVPIEAMAAGLPVVVSDWDGYKDTVRDGVDGYRVPTLMPAAALGADIAQRHALEIDSYDMYCGQTSSLVAVDVAATAAAFSRLFLSPELRQQMGAAGRERARAVYDWSVVIRQYEDLWAQQAALRAEQGTALKPLAHPWPARLEPFHAFAAYPTRLLTAATRLTMVDASVAVALTRVQDYRRLTMIDYSKAVLPTDAEVAVVLQAAITPSSAAELVKALPAERQGFVLRALAWLVKLDVLRVVT